jgi:hypothetical protein
MKMNLDDLTVKFNNDLADKLTEDWTWLIGTNKTPIIVSAIGDMFLKDINGKIYWLDVGQGKCETQTLAARLVDVSKHSRE